MSLRAFFMGLSAQLLFTVANAVTIGPTFGPAGAQLTVANMIVQPDGFQRSAVLAGGTFPGPLITGFKGTHFVLNVHNGLTDDTMMRSTSIHWHGLFQNGTNYSDGPVGVSQCPISPGHSFVYEFSVPDQAGTFWYHSHFATQYCDGLRGALVVYDNKDPHRFLYDVDDASTVITIGEWYHLPAPVVEVSGLPEADATLINGKGRSTGGPLVDLAIVNVEFRKRYRLRVVAISCDPNYIFSIDGHELTIIEVDGQSTTPLVVDSIQLFAGQRFSVVLTANRPIGNYWIRALPSSGKGDLPTGFTGGVNSAILRYKGAPNADPTSQQLTNGKLLQETDLHPLTNPSAPGKPFPGGADVNIHLALDIDLVKLVFLVNGKTFVPPTVPVLLQILNGAQSAQDLLPEGSVYTLPRYKSIEVTFTGGLAGGPHPFHLHGHSFSVVRSAGVDAPYNYINPVRRDVVNIGDVGSNVTIRFRTDNPGPWFLHCHVDWHLNVGLAVVFAEDPKDTAITNKPSDGWRELCPIFDALPPSQTSIRMVTPTAA